MITFEFIESLFWGFDFDECGIEWLWFINKIKNHIHFRRNSKRFISFDKFD